MQSHTTLQCLRFAIVASLVAALVLSGAVSRLPGSPLPLAVAGTSPAPLAEEVRRAGGFTQIDGVLRGAAYRLMRPDAWNGSLVVIIRGTIEAAAPPSIPDDVLAVADMLVARGFGVASSAWASTGFAVSDALIDTRIAESQFIAHFGQPSRSYLWGISQGTHVLQYLAERGRSYDGALSVCGALGGPTLAWTTFVHKRALFDYFFPGVIAGDALSTPTPTLAAFIEHQVPLIVGAVLADPMRAIEMAGVSEFGYEFTGDFAELIEAIVFSVAIATLDGADLVAKAGGTPVDTSTTRYSGSRDDAALNAGIVRFAADRRAASYLGAADPAGRLRMPILELHNTSDPVVPLPPHRDAYLALLGDGADLLRVREIDRFGHCAVTPDELIQAFDELVAWSSTATLED